MSAADPLAEFADRDRKRIARLMITAYELEG